MTPKKPNSHPPSPSIASPQKGSSGKPPTLQPVPDPRTSRPGAAGTHQLDLLLPGEDGGGAEVCAGWGGCWERGAEPVPAACSLGDGKGKEGSDALKGRGDWAKLGPNWGCQYQLLARDWSACGGTCWDLGSPGCWFATLPSGARAAPSSLPLPQPRQHRRREPR